MASTTVYDVDIKEKNYNYLELVILPPNSNITLNETDINVLDVNWSVGKFNHLLNKIKRDKGIRLFERQSHTLCHHNLLAIYEISSVGDKSVSTTGPSYHIQRMQLNNAQIIKNNVLALKYNREILQPYHFPSTTDIMNQYYTNRIVYKMTNRLYLNFEIIKTLDKNDVSKYTLTRRVYINFNNDKFQSIDHVDMATKLNTLVNWF
jgi:hypothetical protein